MKTTLLLIAIFFVGIVTGLSSAVKAGAMAVLLAVLLCLPGMLIAGVIHLLDKLLKRRAIGSSGELAREAYSPDHPTVIEKEDGQGKFRMSARPDGVGKAPPAFNYPHEVQSWLRGDFHF
jgi:hypothetical protein